MIRTPLSVSFDGGRLEDVIRRHVDLSAPVTSKGWHPVLCRVCKDHGKKGKRGAFIFDGDVVAYHCFNCGPEGNTTYDPNKHAKMPFKMRQVLEAWHIPQVDWEPVLLSGLHLRRSGSTATEFKPIKQIEPEEITLPEYFYPLTEAGPKDTWAIVAREYLEYERGLDPDIHPFMLSRQTEHPDSRRWKGRLIIPVYKEERVIFFQGRAFGDAQRKYMSAEVEKSKVLFGFDQLFNGSELPLFIVEGIFDALSINGVAPIGNTLSDEQIQWLTRSPRDKVLIPDQRGDGHIMAHQALDQGWSVSIPDIGNCKDVNEAVCKYGLLYTMRTITNSIATGFAARTAVELKCEKNQSKKTNKRVARRRRT